MASVAVARSSDLGVRRQDARGAAEGFTRSFSGHARCIKKPPQDKDTRAGAGPTVLRWRRLAVPAGRPPSSAGTGAAPPCRRYAQKPKAAGLTSGTLTKKKKTTVRALRVVLRCVIVPFVNNNNNNTVQGDFKNVYIPASDIFLTHFCRINANQET